jgi:hypothetical protein
VHFLGARDAELPLDRDRLSEIEAERRDAGRAGSNGSELEQISSGQLLHG